MSLDNAFVPLEFQLLDVNCKAAHENGCLLITATGFLNQKVATEFFYKLQSYIARVSLNERIAISVPSQLAEPVEVDLCFMAEDSRCAKHGWPNEKIRLWLIQNFGACVYPEHEYVAISEPLKGVPCFSYPLASFVEKLSTVAEHSSESESVDEVFLLAIAGYSQATRSTQWVWSFLLTVMTLEMLATESPSSEETKATVKSLIKYAKLTYGDCPSVDLVRINACLNQATTISKTSAVKALVKQYCAPGVSLSPLSHLYTDAADCDRKVGAIYNVRSKYMHEGRVVSTAELKYTFGELHNIAMESLRHILQQRRLAQRA